MIQDILVKKIIVVSKGRANTWGLTYNNTYNTYFTEKRTKSSNQEYCKFQLSVFKF